MSLDSDSDAEQEPAATSAYQSALVASGHFIRGVDILRQRFAAGLGIGMTEMQTMALIHDNGPMTPTQIASEMKLSTGSVTALLDRLEGNGAVLRMANPNDRRSTLVQLTEAGRSSIGGNYTEYGELVAPIAARRSEKELQVIADFFDELATAFLESSS
ncbi:MAG: MarR family transcriptional regulator [Naasia sp.]